ncbi:MAG: hypothetical protein OEZ58_07470 [Gammaproteobacteria bacterium]|nr:hypothetical protein [Gammaproteobacteria bacterium]MDH5728815.1 hypothetical protein [Gammaproteobacteria bacterium]
MLIIIGTGLGIIAAIIEISLVRTYQKNSIILSAIASHWIAIGTLMPFIQMNVSVWLKGIVVGVVLTLPFIIYDIQQSRNAVIHTAVFAPIWGVFIAYGLHLLT